MGEPKALLSWQGTTLLQYQLTQALASGAHQVVVVLGYQAERLLPSVQQFPQVQVVRNPHPEQGRSSSIICGVAALPAHLDAVAIINVDQPCPAAVLSRLFQAHLAAGALVTIPCYQGQRGHPPVFAWSLRDELLHLSEEREGLKAVSRIHRDRTHCQEVDFPGVAWNLNTLEDYQRAHAELQAWEAQEKPHSSSPLSASGAGKMGESQVAEGEAKPSPSIPILLATTNPAKAERLAWLLEGLPLAPVSLAEAGLHGQSLPENQGSFAEIAAAKATYWSQVFGGLAIASDGGAQIPALGDRWQAERTARFAREAASDEQRVQALLALLQPFRGAQRTAYFTEAVALAQRGHLLQVWTAQGEPGLLAEDYSAEQLVPGFWLETLWYYPSFGKRACELSPAERAQLSTTWARLRAPVQAFLREWLKGSRTFLGMPANSG